MFLDASIVLILKFLLDLFEDHLVLFVSKGLSILGLVGKFGS